MFTHLDSGRTTSPYTTLFRSRSYERPLAGEGGGPQPVNGRASFRTPFGPPDEGGRAQRDGFAKPRSIPHSPRVEQPEPSRFPRDPPHPSLLRNDTFPRKRGRRRRLRSVQSLLSAPALRIAWQVLAAAHGVVKWGHLVVDRPPGPRGIVGGEHRPADHGQGHQRSHR